MTFDVFFSYRRHDLERARPLLTALAAAGVRVWRDENDISEQASITAEIRNGIANSKAFLAFFSRRYPESNACQQELTIAWLAAQEIDGDANRRIWVVNPEPIFGHIPELLRDHRIPLVTADGTEIAAIVQGVIDRLSSLDSLLDSGVRGLPSYHGMSAIQAALFVGRATEMWDLHAKLTSNRMSIITGVYGQAAAQVRGLGGNGKSLLAREYSVRFGPAYPGGVFWLNGNANDSGTSTLRGSETDLQDQIRSFARRIGIVVEGQKPADLEAMLWRHIEQMGMPCLWVVDDVQPRMSWSDVERLYARSARASTLITTRSREYGSLGEHLDLDVLLPGEAQDLLFRHRQPRCNDEYSAALAIVELLGYHPLAIDVAGSYLAKGIETFQQYFLKLNESDQDALEFGTEMRESLPTGHERSISRTLLRSVQLLEPGGMDFLRFASFLGPAPISVGLFYQLIEIADAPQSDSGIALRAVDEVDSLSLCEITGPDCRRVHRLVSRTVRFHLRNDSRIEHLRKSAVQLFTLHLGCTESLRRERNPDEVAHARHLVLGPDMDSDTATLSLLIAIYDRDRGDFGAARKLQKLALDARRGMLGDRHPETLLALHDLAQTVHLLGDLPTARVMKEQVLTGLTDILGAENFYTVSAKHNLAETLRLQGYLREALTLQEQVLASRLVQLDENHPETLRAMNNLAGTLHGMGNLPGARKLKEQVLIKRRRALGEEHLETLTAKTNLAVTLTDQGEFRRARELEQEALKIRQRVQGSQHPESLGVMKNLAVTLRAEGDLKTALELQEQVLAGYQRTLGEEHHDTFQAMNDLAATLRAEGNVVRARELQERALKGLKRVLGEAHAKTLNVVNNLAVTIASQGDAAGARDLQEEVLTHLRDQLGEEHPQTLMAANNLALTVHDQGDLARAFQLQRQVLEIRRRVLSEEHPDTITSVKNLAGTLRSYGRLAEARDLHERALAGFQRVFGEEHEDTLIAMNDLALTLNDQGDFPSARTLLEQILAVRRRISGESLETYTVMNNLAQTMKSLQDFRGAGRIQKRAVEGLGRLLGVEHPTTLTSLNNLAQILCAQGHLKGARKYQETVVEAFRRRLGDQHPKTRMAINNLVAILREQGNRGSARRLENQAKP